MKINLSNYRKPYSQTLRKLRQNKGIALVMKDENRERLTIQVFSPLSGNLPESLFDCHKILRGPHKPISQMYFDVLHSVLKTFDTDFLLQRGNYTKKVVTVGQIDGKLSIMGFDGYAMRKRFSVMS